MIGWLMNILNIPFMVTQSAILPLLTLKEILDLGSTCKSLHTLTHRDSVWKKKLEKHFPKEEIKDGESYYCLFKEKFILIKEKIADLNEKFNSLDIQINTVSQAFHKRRQDVLNGNPAERQQDAGDSVPCLKSKKSEVSRDLTNLKHQLEEVAGPIHFGVNQKKADPLRRSLFLHAQENEKDG